MTERVAVVVYLGAIVAANLLVARYGPGIAVINAFLFIGLDLTLRDVLHEAWRGRAVPMLALIATGGLLSYLVDRDAGVIAVASSVAFMSAALVDWSVYRWLGDRARLIRVNGSNVAGAAVDSVVFPAVAFGSVTLALPLFAAKVAGGFVWYVVLHAVSVRRHPA